MISADLLAYFVRRVPSPQDAAELFGETMLTVLRKIDGIPQEPERQRMWLFVIAAHTLSHHRRSQRRRLEPIDRPREAPSAATTPADVPGTHAVRDAVLRLHDAQRELVMLIHWDGLTIVEAAEILGLDASTAGSRYAMARSTLREALVDANP